MYLFLYSQSVNKKCAIESLKKVKKVFENFEKFRESAIRPFIYTRVSIKIQVFYNIYKFLGVQFNMATNNSIVKCLSKN